MKYKRLIVLLSLITSLFISQDFSSQILYKIDYETIVGSGINTPFWLISNRNGIASLDNKNGYIHIGILKNLDIKKRFDYEYGVDIIETKNYSSKFILQQAYLDLKYEKIKITFGSKEEKSQLKNQALSTGGLSWSGNARPIPNIRFSIPKFISFPWLLNNRLQIKGSLAYGWFTDNKYQKSKIDITHSSPINFYNTNVLYHHKDAFFKYNFDKTWSCIIGIEIEAQFGGNQYYMEKDKLIENSTPATLKHYFMALFPLPGDNQSTASDQAYVYGNNLGSLHAVINYKINNTEMKAYLENPYEDFSGMSKQNGFDGLWGLEYKNNTQHGITGLVLEYLQTTNQSGPIHWAPHDSPNSKLTDQATGRDDYYNNYFYTGWQHWGMTNGNPLITSPIYNTNGSLRIQNNRVKAYHLGLSNRFNHALDGRLLISFSQNFGRHSNPFTEIKESKSMLAELRFSPSKLNGWVFSLSSAFDHGSMYSNNQAISLKISKIGIIFKSN
ncbi:MAG: capsule assembly Wzi family protein [Bacteroidales bacterium]|nr:capsule assembly Wzi family protein [Bacteroidales bacterium]